MKTRIYNKALIVLTAFCLLICTQQSHAQLTVIYDQNFNSSYPNWPTGWSVTTGALTWFMDTSSSNASYAPTAGEFGYPGASGGAMVDIANPDNGDTGTFSLITNAISTVGYNNITAIFGSRLTKNFEDSGSAIKSFSWTTDGGRTWDSLPFKRNPNDSYWHLSNDSTPIALPTQAAQQDSIRFRWLAFIHSYTKSGAASGTYRIDDFIVSGDVSTGINTVNNVSPVKLFPNPASDFVTISNMSGKNYMVRIIDVTGKILKTVYVSDSENRINVSDIDAGFYIAEISSVDNNSQPQALKLIIIR